jgi:hypothetical protein
LTETAIRAGMVLGCSADVGELSFIFEKRSSPRSCLSAKSFFAGMLLVLVGVSSPNWFILPEVQALS